MKRDKHPLAGKTVRLNCKSSPGVRSDLTNELDGKKYTIEDWWINVSGKSWMHSDGNIACLKYAMRSAEAGLPTDNEVVYGHVGPYGHLVHVSELGEVLS